MIKYAVIFMMFLFAGCADLDPSTPITILNKKSDGEGLPDYLDKHESAVYTNASYHQILSATKDALLILGCSDIQESIAFFRGDRDFIPGIVCGVGGETLIVKMSSISECEHRVDIISYKRYPYPAASRFLDNDFVHIFIHLLEDRGD